MNTKVEEALGVLDWSQYKADPVKLAKARTTLVAHIAQQEKMLADCFRMAGADCDGNEDWRIADRALQAVTDLRRDYDEACEELHGDNGWVKRAQAAESRIAQQDATIARLDARNDSMLHALAAIDTALRLPNDGCNSPAQTIGAIESMIGQIDALLAHCPDAECHRCAEIICPEGSGMHFHHDGCPACAEAEADELAALNQEQVK